MMHERYAGELPRDFLDKVVSNPDREDACWGWLGSSHPSGYALYRSWRGSRFVLTNLVGAAPEGKPWALHACDNPPCTNPLHLRWGSPKENTEDMFERGRSANGGRSSSTHCKNGHPWDQVGFFHDLKGTKICKKCRQLSFKSWSERMKAPGYEPPRKTQSPHGTLDRYRWGCRCGECRAAKAEYSRELSIRKKGVYPSHGTTTSYTRGCRCDPCKKAKSEAGKAAYRRRKDRGNG